MTFRHPFVLKLLMPTAVKSLATGTLSESSGMVLCLVNVYDMSNNTIHGHTNDLALPKLEYWLMALRLGDGLLIDINSCNLCSWFDFWQTQKADQ